MNKQKLLQTIVLLAVLAAAVLAVSPAAAAGAADSKESQVILDVYSVTITADSTVTGAGYTVKTKDAGGQEKTVTGNPVFVGKNAQVLIKVNTLPSGYTLAVTTDVPDKTTISGNDVLITEITQDVSVSLTAETTPVTYHTVTFDANGGIWFGPFSREVADGLCVTKPGGSPIKIGYTFDGWYKEGEDVPYDFNTPVHSSFTLTAGYTPLIPVYHTVTFDANGGNPQPEVQYVEDRKRAEKPETNPSKSGFIFDAWYLGNAKYDFSTPVTADITLVARYTKNPSPSPGPEPAPYWPINPTLSDVTNLYEGTAFFAATDASLAALDTTNPQYAAIVRNSIESAKNAGIQVINDKGSLSLVPLNHNISNAQELYFSKVYQIQNCTTASITITVPVPIALINAAGLTGNDVTIYQYQRAYDLWTPLTAANVTYDGQNYYYQVYADSSAPIGALIKNFREGAVPTLPVPTDPVPVQTPAPLIGLLAGFGAAGVLFGLKRK